MKITVYMSYNMSKTAEIGSCFIFAAYKIAEGSDVIYTTRGSWRAASGNSISLSISNNSLVKRNEIMTINDAGKTQVEVRVNDRHFYDFRQLIKNLQLAFLRRFQAKAKKLRISVS